MGCDIHINYEKKIDGRWETVTNVPPLRSVIGKYSYTEYPLDYRNYNVFALLCGVRNYCNITPISEPRGIPFDASQESVEEYERYKVDYHSPSWLLVSELVSYPFPDAYNGRSGFKETPEDFLGSDFFASIKILVNAGVERIVFFFDN